MDRLRVEVIAKTPHPQQVIYAAMHQDYTDGFVVEERDSWPPEDKCGEIIVKRLLAGERGHYGPLEHCQIVFNCGYFPHSVMQQARTHRVGVSFDVQCLSADSLITFVNIKGESSKKLKKTIGELYDLWHHGEQAIRERKIKGRNDEPPDFYRRDCKNRIKKMRVRSLNEENNTFTYNHIEDIVFNGFNPVYQVTLADGKQLKCTQNHKILTPYGWRILAQLGVGSEVLVNGQPLKNADQTYQLCAHPVKIVSIEYVGVEPTYDLVMADPHHNFVANGVVVHNSFRYTGNQVIDVAEGKREIEDVFYLRPVGNYSNRQGKKYYYSPEQRQDDLNWCLEAAKRYKIDFENGMSEEQARGKLPFDYRQHFVVSFTLRALLHFLDLRFKKDAQLEIQQLCDLMWPHVEEWVPAIAQWYKQSRLGKARLSP